MFVCQGEADVCIWKPSPSGVFSSSSFSKTLKRVLAAKSPSSLMWLGLFSPRVEVFYWLAVSEKVYDLRRGLTSKVNLDLRLLCGKENKTIDRWCYFRVFGWHG